MMVLGISEWNNDLVFRKLYPTPFLRFHLTTRIPRHFWLRFDLDQKTSDLIKTLDGHEIPGLVFCERESFFENENWVSISRITLAEVEDFTSLNVLNAEVRDISSICSYKIMVGGDKTGEMI